MDMAVACARLAYHASLAFRSTEAPIRKNRSIILGIFESSLLVNLEQNRVAANPHIIIQLIVFIDLA